MKRETRRLSSKPISRTTQNQLGSNIYTQQHSGIALITVLIIVAIISVLAVNANERSYLAFSRHQLQADYQQARWHLHGARNFGLYELKLALSQSDISHPAQAWQQTIQLPFDQGWIRARAQDRHQCFNVNALNTNTNKQSALLTIPQRQFQHLLSQLGTQNPERIINEIAGQLEARQFLASSELSQFFTGQHPQWIAIKPLICTLPSAEIKWNINSFGPKQLVLLQALLLDQADKTDLIRLLEANNKRRWLRNFEFWEAPGIAELDLPSTIKLQLNLKPEFYRMRVHVRFNDAQVEQNILLRYRHDELDIQRIL